MLHIKNKLGKRHVGEKSYQAEDILYQVNHIHADITKTLNDIDIRPPVIVVSKNGIKGDKS